MAEVSFSISSRTPHLEFITPDKQHGSSCALFSLLTQIRNVLSAKRLFTCHGHKPSASTSPTDVFPFQTTLCADPSLQIGGFATTLWMWGIESRPCHCNMTPAAQILSSLKRTTGLAASWLINFGFMSSKTLPSCSTKTADLSIYCHNLRHYLINSCVTHVQTTAGTNHPLVSSLPL